MTQHVAEQVVEEEAAEDVKERLEREHGEMLEELRAMIPGAEVLLGFLLAIFFTDRFDVLTALQETVYYVTLVSTATALVMFLAPAARHRLRFRQGDKDFILRKGNIEAIVGSVATAVALCGVLFLVTSLVFDVTAAIGASTALLVLIAWRWWLLALTRRNRRPCDVRAERKA
jgi:hypothetical protein